MTLQRSRKAVTLSSVSLLHTFPKLPFPSTLWKTKLSMLNFLLLAIREAVLAVLPSQSLSYSLLSAN